MQTAFQQTTVCVSAQAKGQNRLAYFSAYFAPRQDTFKVMADNDYFAHEISSLTMERIFTLLIGHCCRGALGVKNPFKAVLTECRLNYSLY